MSEVCQIYVACLSSYVHGHLHGEWIDATQDEEGILAEIHTMLAASPVTELYGEVAEEFAIHSYATSPYNSVTGEAASIVWISARMPSSSWVASIQVP